MRRLSTTFFILVFLALGAPAQLSAQLADCDQGEASPFANLPVGDPGDPGHAWRVGLRGWITQRQAAEFDYGSSSTEIVPPWIVYGPYQQPSDFTSSGACEAAWGNPSIWSLDQQRHIEQFYLFKNHRNGPDWVAEFLNIDPQRFTLPYMLEDYDCKALTPNMLWNGTPALLAEWDYPGNPFFSDPVVAAVVRKRLGVWLALQLILLEDAAWDKHDPQGTVPATGHRFHHPYVLDNNQRNYQVGLEEKPSMGVALMGMAAAYSAIQSEPWFTGPLAEHFTTGLLTQAERTDLAGYWDLHGNRLTPMVIGLQMVYNATLDVDANGPSADDWYLSALDDVFTKRYFDAGYLTQDLRYDPNYSSKDFYQVVRLLENHDPNLPGGAPLIQLYAAAHGIHDLKAHMVLADATGLFFGPSAMGTRLGGSANGSTHGNSVYDPAGTSLRVQAQLYAGELALPFADAILRGEADFGLYGRTNYAPFTRLIDPLDPVADFHVALGCRTASSIATSATWPAASESVEWPAAGDRGYYTPEHLIFNHQVPATGSLFKKRAQRIQNEAEARLLPYELPGPYLRSFDDEILFAKYGGSGVWGENLWKHCPTDPQSQDPDLYHGSASDLAAILHVGPVSPGDDSTSLGLQNIIGVFGYGGGQLAGLWSPGTGIALLNRRLGRNQDSPAADDDWPQWRELPIHAATLLTADDAWVSSSRIIDPDPVVLLTDEAPTFSRARAWLGDAALPAVNPVAQEDAVSTVVEVHGPLPEKGYDVLSTGPSGQVVPAALAAGEIDYRRRFVVSPGLVFVRTRLTPAAGSQTWFQEAWETVPLFLGRTSYGPNPVVPPGDPPCAFGAGAGQTLERSPRVEFVTAGGAILDMTNSQSLIESVSVVRLHRNDGRLSIHFDTPQSIRLSAPFLDQSATQPGDAIRRFQLRNLMIDLRPSGAGGAFQLAPVDLSYYFSFSAAEEEDAGAGGGDGDGGD